MHATFFTRPNLRRRFQLLLAITLACRLTAALAAAPGEPPAATVTILQGEASLIRGLAKGPLSEGIVLHNNDILESSAATRLLRVEMEGGATLDLGPSTRLMLLPGRQAKPPSPALAAHLLQGWVKWTAAQPPVPGDRLSIPRMEIDGMTRAVVIRVLPDAGNGNGNGTPTVSVFAESGQAQLRTRGSPPESVPLSAGDFLVAGGAAAPKRLPRPNPEFSRFAKDLPPMFADTLPRRLAAWQNRKVDLRPAEAVNYPDVSDWLHADPTEPGLRPTFAARWKSRLQNDAFRQAMLTDLPLHPEWRSLLIPPAPPPRPPAPVVAAPRPAASEPEREAYSR